MTRLIWVDNCPICNGSNIGISHYKSGDQIIYCYSCEKYHTLKKSEFKEKNESKK